MYIYIYIYNHHFTRSFAFSSSGHLRAVWGEATYRMMKNDDKFTHTKHLTPPSPPQQPARSGSHRLGFSPAP